MIGNLINGFVTNLLAGGDIAKGLMMNASLLAGKAGLPNISGLLSNSGQMVAAPTIANAANTGGIFSNAPAGMTAAPPTLFDLTSNKVKSGLNTFGSFAQNNPVLSNMAMQAGMNALEPPPPLQSGGLIQGRPQQIDMLAGMPNQPFMPQRKISLL